MRECCVVPYRWNEFGVEFCLVTLVSKTYWEFPKISLAAENLSRAALLDLAAASAGLKGHVYAEEPLGECVYRRGNEEHSMIAYLMHIVGVAKTWPQQSTHRRLWCPVEEGRMRICRKALGQFMDVAVRRVNGRPHEHRSAHDKGSASK
jgi:hypothetical protein